MAELESVFEWLQATAVARSVAESLPVTAWLSAVHILGFTLVMGGAVVMNLRFLGVALARHGRAEVARVASRAIALGLAVSIATGALLFSGRAAEVAANGTFRIKMLLLLAAAVLHFGLQTRLAARATEPARALQAAAALGLALWLGLALAACAFILLE